MVKLLIDVKSDYDVDILVSILKGILKDDKVFKDASVSRYTVSKIIEKIMEDSESPNPSPWYEPPYKPPIKPYPWDEPPYKPPIKPYPYYISKSD